MVTLVMMLNMMISILLKAYRPYCINFMLKKPCLMFQNLQKNISIENTTPRHCLHPLHCLHNLHCLNHVNSLHFHYEHIILFDSWGHQEFKDIA